MINKNIFYKKFTHFDWNFYINNYRDLQVNGVNNEQTAINHYWYYGQYELRRTHEINKIQKIEINKIPAEKLLSIAQIAYISRGLIMFKDRFMKKFNLQDYNLITDKKKYSETCIFFGMYTDEDIITINNHKGLKLLIWGGEDINLNKLHSLNILNEIIKITNIIHISISKCIYNSLYQSNINSIYINFNLVDTNIFKIIPKTELGNKIFIFNGQIKGREYIYGKVIYEEIIKLLPQYEYIFSNTLNVNYEDMPNIYKQCFIMLRLTNHDGNANSVQECELLQIPVVHNFSDYGLKWKNINDIINYILTFT